MNNSFTVFHLIFFAFILNTAAENAAQPPPKNNSGAKHHLSYRIINSEENTFGYDIMKNNHAIIHQLYVPGLPGIKGFATKQDAVKVAKLVINKINKNIMPPSVTLQELKKLKIKM